MIKYILLTAILATTISSCRKKGCTDPLATNYNDNAKKEDGSCEYKTTEETYDVPTAYEFTDADGNSTVSYSGQTDRLNQLREMIELMEGSLTSTISAADLKDMFANTGDNGNGKFTFTSSKQLKDKCFALDQDVIESWMDSIAVSSSFFADTAEAGKPGVLYSGTSAYLVNRNGVQYSELIEKGIMGAVFMHQALNVYFSADKMEVDNTSAVDVANGKYYTTMEHHFDEGFGYFGVDVSFPAVVASDFWGKYCNAQDPILNSNSNMMGSFTAGRAAISNADIANRDKAIKALRESWEEICAYEALSCIDKAIGFFGNDDAEFMHVLSKAYGFAQGLRYAAEDTRNMTPTEHAALMALFKINFWDMTVQDLNQIKTSLLAKY